MQRRSSFFETNVDKFGRSASVYSQQKVSPIVRCRAANLPDLVHLKEFVDKTTEIFFGTDDIKTAFELSYITIIAENNDKEIVAGVFLNNFPNLKSIPSSDWTSWIKKIYNLTETNSSNTLFVHLAVYNQKYSKLFFEPILKKIFKKILLIKYVIVIIPPQKKFIDFLPKRMTVVQPKTSLAMNPQKITIYLRQDYVRLYKIRQAVIEDNDDLIPLIDSHSQRLKKLYGDYYMAEIISDTSSTKTRHTIVSEFNGIAVGIIIFNDNLNLKLLKNYFELECFYGLRKYNEYDDEKYDYLYDHDENYYDDHFNLIRKENDYENENENEFELEHEGKHENENDNENDSLLRAALTSNQDISLSLYSSLTLTDTYSNLYSLSEKGSCSSDKSIMEPSFKGKVEGKFSCNLLHFNGNELKKWLDAHKTDEVVLKSISCYGTLRKFFEKKRYHGSINAFTLELLAAWPEHEKSLAKLLQAGFELFPDKDYCVLCTPSTAPFFQLLTKMFIRVTPSVGSNFAHELYVVHRNSLYCTISIRKANYHDAKEVKKLLFTMGTGEKVFKTFQKYLKSKFDNCQCYVIQANEEIIGVVNLKDLNNTAYILSRYQISRMTDLSRHRPCSFGRIKHFALSPIFQRHARFLLLELHRLSDYSLLIHLVEPDTTYESFRSDPLACVLNELIAVLPAKVPDFLQCDSENLGWTVPEVMIRQERPYAVYLSTPMYCGVSRFEINTKIVVVGASEVGLSFLIELIFNGNPNLHTIFNNVTLVSTHGIPKYKSNTFTDTMLPVSSEKTSGYYLSLVSLVSYVNIVTGVMSAIDRKAKTITVNQTQLPYDMLFLTCGTQFQPVQREEEINNKENRCVTECPENVFVINTSEDVQWATKRIKSILCDKRKQGKFIVYGNCIEAYCCLEALLKINTNPEEILFVIPTFSENLGTLPAFNESSIEKMIQDEIERLGIQIFKHYSFCDWTFDKNYNQVTSIMFQTKTRTHKMDVKAAFMYQYKSISRITFTAINRANLIFDGALVINPNFETNDPHIFAAGRITKYPRKYYADHMRHTFFNQSEIGKRMAELILNKVIPAIDIEEDDADDLFRECFTTDGKVLVPWFRKPVEVFAEVPRGIQYLYVRKPGVCLPMDIASMDDRFGQILTTGDYNHLEQKGYFLLHLNQYSAIETIIALSKGAIQRNNLTLLWGKHESLFNNLAHRYKTGLIRDFFKFFSKPWIQAMFDDNFEVLEKDINKLLLQKSIEPGRSIIEDIISKIEQNDNDNITLEQYDDIFNKFEDSQYQKEVEQMVMDFLSEKRTQLPMYATPGAITMILGAFEESPLFTAL